MGATLGGSGLNGATIHVDQTVIGSCAAHHKPAPSAEIQNVLESSPRIRLDDKLKREFVAKVGNGWNIDAASRTVEVQTGGIYASQSACNRYAVNFQLQVVACVLAYLDLA